MSDVKLTKAQERLLRDVVEAGTDGTAIPGTLGSTAKVLRRHDMIEYVGGQVIPLQRATAAGRRWIEQRDTEPS